MPKFAQQIDAMGIPVKGFKPEAVTAFPGAPTEGLLVHRTDLKQFFGYLNGAWVRTDNAGTAAAVHIHAIADVTGLQAALDAKSATGHTHVVADTTGLQAALDGKAPTVHNHTTAQVTGLDAALASKATPADISAAIAAVIDGAPGAIDTLNELAAALGDDPNFATTMTNALAGKAPTVHGHVLTDANITGTLAIAKGGTGATTAAGARTALGAVGRYTANIAALTAGASLTVTHNLNTTSPVVSFLVNSSNESIELGWTAVDANNISVLSDLAWAANALRLSVVG